MSHQVTDLNTITATTAITIALSTPGSSGAAEGSKPRNTVGVISSNSKATKMDKYSLCLFAKHPIANLV
ncbi:hypothetical protein BDD43_3379 [Mucilaginibacter gracilis]|uniref:Uncharacterized protein n=1 Tax=Mucilaginibacter gracilis TaxID=423350 RepID=A0A495J2L2_9SPHI|nr:hypothetical protein BDD43_3379 [Mucilaginibacter gracilis]